MVLTKIKNVALARVNQMYLKSMSRKLNYFGLKYDDLYREEDPVVGEALRRLTPEQQRDRQRRLFRAADISLKRVPLPEHIQSVLNPFDYYLRDKIKEVEEEHKERTLLNSKTL